MHMRILVIDAFPGTGRALQAMLPCDELVFETDPNVARSLIVDAKHHGTPFAVVICDVAINPSRGIDVLQTARAPCDPALFLFMASDDAAVEAAWLADGVLLKPLRADEVVNTIRRLAVKRTRATTRRMRAVEAS